MAGHLQQEEKSGMQAGKDPGRNKTDSIMPAECPDPGIKFPSDNRRNM